MNNIENHPHVFEINKIKTEATISPKGDRIVFTSMRTGDLELFTMNLDGSDVRQITDEPSYDGGAFFYSVGSQLVFRASRPTTEEEIATHESLLDKGLVQPTQMELFICNADDSNLRQVTELGNANWAPFFHPSGDKIIFSSNHESERGFPFNLKNSPMLCIGCCDRYLFGIFARTLIVFW